MWLLTEWCDRWDARSERDAWKERCRIAERKQGNAEAELRAVLAKTPEENVLPGLTPAQIERLAWLIEEMGEAVRAAAKTLRHGYRSSNPFGGPTNQVGLERELGDVRAAMQMIINSGDVRAGDIKVWLTKKTVSVHKWMHHQ
jgi:NTP pyrophosphatase (non-canonical NTP hydrolase)